MYRILSGLLLLLIVPIFALILYHFPANKSIQNPVVDVRKEEVRYMLYRHGNPYFIKDVGVLEYMDKIA